MDNLQKKRVLITGANSFIGTSFENWAIKHYPAQLSISTLDMINPEWHKFDFSSFDSVFHVAGIAHADTGNVSEEIKAKYYAVNTDLSIETCRKAKKDGVKQFVFMSSAIIYGESAPYGKIKRINKGTQPAPANFYGDSKWQADKGVRAEAADGFNVAVIRPPMIYGKNSKGNYPLLSKLAKILPVFPDVKNERSMLYIDNLCEFLCQLIMRGDGGIYWPQNTEYVSTSSMVRRISKEHGHKIWVSSLFNFPVWLCSKMPGKIGRLANKAFGSMSYEKKLSQCGFNYNVCDFSASIEHTESDCL